VGGSEASGGSPALAVEGGRKEGEGKGALEGGMDSIERLCSL